jgi:branched-chain amino acid transport system substrate-binding protein
MPAWIRSAARAGSGGAVLAVALLASSCTAPEQSAQPAQLSEVRIGILAPLSGPSRAAGSDALHGAQLAAAVVSGDTGGELPTSGLVDLGGGKVTLVSADTKSDPAAASAAAVRLVTQERAAGLVGAYDTEVTAAASQRTERLGVPFVNGDTSTGYLTERGLDWFFRTGPTDRMFGEAFYSVLRERGLSPRISHAAVLFADDTLGNGMVQELERLAEEGGGYDLVPVGFEPAARDPGADPQPTAEVARVRGAQPDAVFLVAASSADARRVLQAFADAGYTPPRLLTLGSGFLQPDILATAPAGNELFRSAAWSREVASRNPAAKPILDLYERRFKQPMTEVAAGSFTAVLTLVTAARDAGSVDPQRVRAALLSLDVPGRDTIMPWNGVRFDASHQNARANGVVEQRVRGGLRIIFPGELATARG